MQVEETTTTEDAPTPESTSVVPGWLPTVLMVLFLAVVARQGTRAISDPDTFWHLTLGHAIIDARSVSSVTEPWSSVSDQPWVPTQWLTEIVVASAQGAAGLPAVAWLFTLSLMALVLLLHRLTRSVADAVPAAFTTGITVVAMAASLSPRPHMVTYLCLVLTLLAWRGTTSDLRPRWWLIPMTWVWAMSHGMWFVGPVLGLAILVGLALDGRLDHTNARRLAAVPFASVVVAALTPVGPALLGAPLAVAGVGAFITEWQAPSFRSPGPAVAALMVAVIVVAWSRSTRRIPWTEVMLLALAVGWILLSTRTVALGALTVSPLVAATLHSLLGRDLQAPTVRASWSLRISAIVIAGVAALVVPHTAEEPTKIPAGLDSGLEALEPGVVFNDYKLGGWLRWRHPHLTPVVDGMSEAYSVQHLRDYGRTQAVAGGWEDTFDRWDPEAAVLLDNSPLATALVDQRGWTSVAEDEGYVLLVPSS
ncbi:hypothetical protein [Nocardioides astragali]|uniref:Glycosyltransferase RgtA/B/C/D-like domain-containing protein n=1 Tax=Nocardioides astragali TaxID=1776736 RepID=A0ABW2N6X8_9ACTN|nr:hypothetical protein [Nocardioides astragali]